MTYKPVDTAITMIVGPLIDDTDFKSLEEAIAYNAAGMDVSLVVEKTDGTTAVTAITLTTGGTSDWTHKDGGYYEIEVTAAQNIEEGIGYIRGVCDGVLPFESIHYNIVKANIYDSWIKGTDILQSDVTQLGGVTQSATDLKDFADAGYDPTTNKITGTADMRGTDSANTVVPDAAGVAPTVIEIRTEMDANSTKMAPSQTLNDYKATGFNTTVPDAAGTLASYDPPTRTEATADKDAIIADLLTMKKTAAGTWDRETDSLEAIRDQGDAAWVTGAGGSAPTVGEIRTEMEGAGTKLSEVLIDTTGLNGDAMVGTNGANTITPPTVIEIRTEMDANSTKMAPSQTLNDYKATGFATENPPSQVLADYKATGFSTHSATDIWSSVTRSLTDKNGFALSTSGIKAIWDQLTSGLTTIGSLGKLFVDNINATISSRSPSNEYDTEMGRLDVAVSTRNAITPNIVIPDIAGTAATLHGITDGKIDVVDGIVDAIKLQTDNLPSGITKNEALPKFDFLMVLSSDHVSAATGKTVTGEISKDGGTFATITNTITEVSSGMYTIADGFTATEMNADIITLKFDADDSDTRIISIITT